MRTVLASLCLMVILSVDPATAGRHDNDPPVVDEPFSDIFVFGGPLEDIGNYASVFGDLPPPFYMNRFSDGPLAVEIFVERLGLDLAPSLHRVGPVQGNNFSSVDALASGDGRQDLGGQLDAYLESTGGQADPDALYYIIIGGNEVILATYEEDDAAAVDLLEAAVDAKETAIRRLVAAGAETILMPNFIDIGITPQIRMASLSERGAEMTDIHNRLLDRMLKRVERQLDFELIRDDFFGFTNSVLDSAAVLNFTNTTESCLEQLETGECDFEQFIFFNDLFPTARVHELWAGALTFDIINRNQAEDKCEAPKRRKDRYDRRWPDHSNHRGPSYSSYWGPSL